MRCGGVFNLFEFTNPGACDVINVLIISVKSKYDVYNSGYIGFRKRSGLAIFDPGGATDARCPSPERKPKFNLMNLLMARFYPKCGRGLVKMLVLMLLCVTLGAYAQTPVMKGVIRDQNGNPLVGVTVIEKGTTNGTSSNTDGSYSISLRGTNPVLVFQSIGYTPQEFTVGKGQTRLDVTLKRGCYFRLTPLWQSVTVR